MDILPEIRRRRSPLVFADSEVEKEKMDVLIEVARWAPSCFNNQPWNYVLVDRDNPTRKGLEDALSRGNSWAKRAPYLVAVGLRPDEDCGTNGLPYYAYDAGLSVMNLVIEAEHQGLRVHQMAGYREDEARKALGFPEGYRVVVLFALGYEGDAKSIWDKLEERVKERLAEPRKRKPRHENFFFCAFGGL